MASDLVKRLLSQGDGLLALLDTGKEAADRITELEAEVGRLRDALLDAQAESEMAQVLARDEGQSETLALIDRMTEGDGEYRVSLDPERHCPDECAMIIKIVDRFKAIRENAKQNNNLAKMYKQQADEFRAKYVAAVGGPD